ncbi:hypothetical protein Hanom_Chr06g00565251 [Helianthus anomalus]
MDRNVKFITNTKMKKRTTFYLPLYTTNKTKTNKKPTKMYGLNNIFLCDNTM